MEDADEAALRAEAVETFNRGDFYAAHDLFEALWGEDLYKGLVQASVALHHLSVGNLKGLEGLPENVARILAPYRPSHDGLDVEAFLADFTAFFDAVHAGRPPPMERAPRLRSTASDQDVP